MERFDKIISSQFGISRSDARKNIRWGKATVNGKTERDPSALYKAEGLELTYRGQVAEYKKYLYLILNKPTGIISASNDKSRKTVVDLVPQSLRRNDMFPVGRLDRDTTGLLLITDDGDFAHKAISPKSKIPKTYIAELDGDITDNIITDFRQGVTLADGTKCAPAILKELSSHKVEITITEGKYHQIKRMFGIYKLGVNKLHRSSFGGLKLPLDLAEGECRELTKDEYNSIF